MALFTLSSPATENEENLPSAWLTALGLLLLVGVVVNEVIDVSINESLVLAGTGINFLSIYLVF